MAFGLAAPGYGVWADRSGLVASGLVASGLVVGRAFRRPKVGWRDVDLQMRIRSTVEQSPIS